LHYTNATAYGEFSFYKGSNGSYIDSSGAATLANNDLIFRTGGTASNYGVSERMRIKSLGSIDFKGTDATTIYNFGENRPDATNLRINGGNNNKLQIQNSESDKIVLHSSGASFFNGGEVLINTTTDSGAYYLQVNGSVYATAYYESSDIRLKDVITNSYSENFSAIEFMWKDKRDDKKHWGYAAQDVMKYIPDAIEVNNDGMMTVNYNEAHTWKIAQLEAKILELESKLK